MNNPAIDIPITITPAKRQWSLPVWLVIICFVTFSVLLGAGVAIWKNAPPIPAIVRSPAHEIVLTQADIQNG